ncbi:hypothetical protein [Clostridium homopropionicum]|nr:hypothetical protein [Clostridium homopropionicum]
MKFISHLFISKTLYQHLIKYFIVHSSDSCLANEANSNGFHSVEEVKL